MTILEEQAIALLCNRSFHRSLWLPRTSMHDCMRVTFATTTNFGNDDLPTILFCGPMFGSRWNAIDLDHLANQIGVRCICIDRPGKGGSHPISPLSKRIPLWLETVPLVLAYLGIERLAALMSHSAGTIYALNTLYHLRHLLSSDGPVVAMIAPYVDNTHSQAMLTNFLVKLPSNVLSAWDPLTRFINQRIMPVTNWSGNLFESSSRISSPTDGQRGNDGAMTAGQRYGVDEKVARDIETGMMRFLLTEDTSAVNDEVLLCLKKGGVGCWGVAEDYGQFVQRVMEKETETRRACHTSAKLRVKVWFAENDVMSGKGGQDYFEACWRQSGVDEMLDFDSVVLQGTTHDSVIIDHQKGALRSVFEMVAGRTKCGRNSKDRSERVQRQS